MSLLIGSCFWINDDRDGFYASAVKELVQRERPAFKFLMGDQLYADVWAPKPINLRKGLADKYERYWGDAAYQELLAACPNIVSCDDHEFWNDYPEPQIQVPYSWDRFGPDNAQALKDLFDAYQAALNPQGKRWSRARRRARQRSSSPTPARIARRTARRSRGSPARRCGTTSRRGRATSRARACSSCRSRCSSTAAARPTARCWTSRSPTASARSSSGARRQDRRPPHDILILTGDIHTGRISQAEIVGAQGQVYELVASPASLVTPFLPPWGHKPSALPDRLTINRRTWTVTATQRLTATVDNNIGLIKIAPGRNGRTRFSLQLWRVRPLVGIGKRILGQRPAKGAQPIHDPVRTRAPLRRRPPCSGTPRATNRTPTSRSSRPTTRTTWSSSPRRSTNSAAATARR